MSKPIINRTAKREFFILKGYLAGISLTGAEVKSVRLGRMKLEGSYIKFSDKGLVLVNAFIAPYKYAETKDYDPRRTRLLLLTKKELTDLRVRLKSSKGLTIVPLICYNKGCYIKLKIGLAKGKKKFEQKRVEKEKERKREIEKEIKKYIN